MSTIPRPNHLVTITIWASLQCLNIYQKFSNGVSITDNVPVSLSMAASFTDNAVQGLRHAVSDNAANHVAAILSTGVCGDKPLEVRRPSDSLIVSFLPPQESALFPLRAQFWAWGKWRPAAVSAIAPPPPRKSAKPRELETVKFPFCTGMPGGKAPGTNAQPSKVPCRNCICAVLKSTLLKASLGNR
jgi:hypothetical protein